MSNLLPVSPQSIAEAAKIILNGGLVAFPTETVYGLGADVYNSEAIAKVFEVKGRPRFDPLIIHIAAVETLESAADLSLLSAQSRKKLFLLAEKLWPGPLSIVLPKSDKISDLATAGLKTAAFRLPAHDAARELISLSTGAVAAPSANPFGSLSPTRAEHVRDKLGEKIDMILDGGPCQIGVESTVLDLTGEKAKILRPGGTPREKIEELTGSVEFSSPLVENGSGLSAPGQLKSHYSPKTPLFTLTKDEMISLKYEKTSVFLFFDAKSRDEWLKGHVEGLPQEAVIKVLSESGQLIEAAAHLFELLHELDSLKLSNNNEIHQIYAQFAPEHGLGEAINDRLRRAGVKI